MSRKVFAALTIMLLGWTAESQAGFMQPLFAGLSPFEARKLGFSAPSAVPQLCISPCFSMEGYIADSVFAARNDFVNFSPRSFPGLFPHGLIYPDAGQTHQKKRKHKRKHKHERKTNPITDPVFLPSADLQLTETNDAPPPGG